MTTKKRANDIANALIENQHYALNSQAKPVPRLYRFAELAFFEPYKRKAIIAESQRYAVRQPRFVCLVIALIIFTCLTAYQFWPEHSGQKFFIFLLLPLAGNIPLILLKRKLMLNYIKLKISAISGENGNFKDSDEEAPI